MFCTKCGRRRNLHLSAAQKCAEDAVTGKS